MCLVHFVFFCQELSREQEETQEQEGDEEGSSEEEEEEEEDEGPMPLRFRNYAPRDEKLKPFQLPQPVLPNIVEEIDAKLAQVRKANAQRDVLSLAPKKANWDLQRDMAKKLEILEHRTQKAIYEMVYERIQAEKGQGGSLVQQMAMLASVGEGDQKEGEEAAQEE